MIVIKVISIRESREYLDEGLKYIQDIWASENSMMVYDDCIKSSLDAKGTLPQWYLLYDGDSIIGCAGLITNDFISRMDLYPWICALYIEKSHRGRGFGELLLSKAKDDAKKGGFKKLYLCTDHIGYYEKYGFEYVATGYHPWGESSRIYSFNLE